MQVKRQTTNPIVEAFLHDPEDPDDLVPTFQIQPDQIVDSVSSRLCFEYLYARARAHAFHCDAP